jgi:serine/threonine protein kinase
MMASSSGAKVLSEACVMHLGRYNQSADVWSFGIVLLELARGKVPLSHCSFTRIILETVHGPAPCLESTPEHKFSKVGDPCSAAPAAHAA